MGGCFHPTWCLAVIWSLAFTIACWIWNASAFPLDRASAPTTMARFFGGTRALFGERFFLKADNVFHKGIPPSRDQAFVDYFGRVRAELVPQMHRHLGGQDLKEIMPWLYFSVQMDPANVTAWIVAAFWLSEQLERPDLAEDLLRHARRLNPHDYQLCQEMGRLWLRVGKWDAAARILDAAVRLWDRYANSADEQARLDLAQILFYRGVLAELQNDPELAKTCYARILDYFPARESARQRRDALLAGVAPQPPPALLLDNMLAHNRHICQHAQGEHEHNAHAH